MKASLNREDEAKTSVKAIEPWEEEREGGPETGEGWVF